MTHRPLIFDMDGTLIDSVKVVTETFQQVMRECAGRTMEVEEFLPFIGPPLHESFATLGVDDPDAYVREYRARYKTRHLEVPLFDGVAAMLASLGEARVPMVVATSKEQTNAITLAEHLGIDGYFVEICGADETAGRGEKSLIVGDALRVLNESGFDASRAVMVGDRKYDIEGAGKHGIPTILVGWGPTPDEEYAMAWKVGRTAESMTDLLLGLE